MKNGGSFHSYVKLPEGNESHDFLPDLSFQSGHFWNACGSQKIAGLMPQTNYMQPAKSLNLANEEKKSKHVCSNIYIYKT